MKTKFYTLLLSIAAIPVFSQVGINTTTPQSTLDVNGNVIIRQIPQGSSVSGYQVLAINQTNSEISRLDAALLSGGGGTTTNSSVYAARKSSGTITLLSLGIFPTGFRAVNFVNAERTIGSSALFSDNDNTYTVPSTGVYAIGFSFRYGSGLQGALLSNSPGIGLVRTRAGVSTVIDNRTFSGANLGILSLTISESSMNSLYPLQAGDKISFGLTGSSLLDGTILSTSTSSFYIYKISD